MDFAFTDEQRALGELAERMFRAEAPPERLRRLERADGPRFDRDLWAAMARAGLTGLAVPEAFGGGGLGLLDLAIVLEQVARAAAPVPYLETTVLGALAIATWGSDAQRQAWLPRVCDGTAVLTAALEDADAEAGEPRPVARREGRGWVLSGAKAVVPAGQIADAILVPAATDSGTIVFVVTPARSGVRVAALATTSGQPHARLTLDDVHLEAKAVLGDPAGGDAIVAWVRERATAGLCAMGLGVAAQALALTAEYTKGRKQFGQPIATFQAVGHRAADAYIDTEAVRLTAWQAAWRLDAGLPATAELAVAKYWTAAAGQRVLHAAQHLHGGVGVDRDYPLHRHFLWAKEIELALGGATAQLRALGRMLADGLLQAPEPNASRP